MIVGIGHKMRRGKDTAADALVRELGFVKVSFADALKDLAMEANPIVLTEPGFVNVQLGHNSLQSLVERYGWEYVKDHYPLVRPFLQRLGRGARKVFGENFWFEQWTERAGVDADVVGTTVPRPVVVPDVRFLNEAESLQSLSALLIRIDRKVPTTDSSGGADESENDLDSFKEWDAVIENNGTISDLQREIVEKVSGHFSWSPENVKEAVDEIDRYPVPS